MFDYCVIGNTKTMVDKVPLKKKERERDLFILERERTCQAERQKERE